MDPLTLALAGGGVGLLKGLFVDGPQAAQQNKINAATARYSPWTGMKADTEHKNANLFGDAITGAALGGLAGQSGVFGGADAGPFASEVAAGKGALAKLGQGAAAAAPGASLLAQGAPAWQTMLQNGFSQPNYGLRGLSLLGG